jgi:chromosome segregation ATPase
MTLWELIKKGAEDGLEAMKDGLSIFMAEAGKTSRILKKRVELTSVQGNVRKAFIHLGSVAYELQSREEPDIYAHEEVEELIAEIDGYKAKVREIEREIETIHTEEQKKPS